VWGRRCSSCWSRDSPAAHTDVHIITNIYTAACKEPHTGLDEHFLKVLPPVESPCWSRFSMLGRVVTSEEVKLNLEDREW